MEDKRRKRKWVRAESSRASSQPDEGRRSSTGRIFIVAECIRETKGKRKREKTERKETCDERFEKDGRKPSAFTPEFAHSTHPRPSRNEIVGGGSIRRETDREGRENTARVRRMCRGTFFSMPHIFYGFKKEKRKKNSMQRSDY